MRKPMGRAFGWPKYSYISNISQSIFLKKLPNDEQLERETENMRKTTILEWSQV
jgi:hypothetical protein